MVIINVKQFVCCVCEFASQTNSLKCIFVVQSILFYVFFSCYYYFLRENGEEDGVRLDTRKLPCVARQ